MKELRQELAMHDTLANRGRITYEAYTAEQQYEQQKVAKDFLEGKIDDIQIESLRQVRELFLQFRNLYKNVAREASNMATVPPQQDQEEVKHNLFRRSLKKPQRQQGLVRRRINLVSALESLQRMPSLLIIYPTWSMSPRMSSSNRPISNLKRLRSA
jgi:hypothetical protein